MLVAQRGSLELGSSAPAELKSGWPLRCKSPSTRGPSMQLIPQTFLELFRFRSRGFVVDVAIGKSAAVNSPPGLNSSIIEKLPGKPTGTSPGSLMKL